MGSEVVGTEHLLLGLLHVDPAILQLTIRQKTKTVQSARAAASCGMLTGASAGNNFQAATVSA
jgi:hypothetical protein